MTLIFDIDEDKGVFRYSEGAAGVEAVLDDALDRREAGTLREGAFMAILEDLVAAHPAFIDGHAHLGYALLEQDQPRLALEACLRGVLVGEQAIPAGFGGPIGWGFLGNRPFLRAVHGAILCHLELGDSTEAVRLMARMLAWNPSDNQGVRYMIGSEYLRSGKTGKARSYLKAAAKEHPPCQYELGLLELRRGDYVAAATQLRHAFVANIYIAEILCGTPDPRPLVIWHGTNLAEPELAQDYVEHYGDLWRTTGDAIAFLHWLYTHPKVMMERAAVLECREALRWEHEPAARRPIIDREDKALLKIDGRLSEEIVRERTDRYGRSVLPWR